MLGRFTWILRFQDIKTKQNKPSELLRQPALRPELAIQKACFVCESPWLGGVGSGTYVCLRYVLVKLASLESTLGRFTWILLFRATKVQHIFFRGLSQACAGLTPMIPRLSVIAIVSPTISIRWLGSSPLFQSAQTAASLRRRTRILKEWT